MRRRTRTQAQAQTQTSLRVPIDNLLLVPKARESTLVLFDTKSRMQWQQDLNQIRVRSDSLNIQEQHRYQQQGS
eukprot:3437222-Amphidinium_carterae.1